jgi:predicted nucleotidyltransferase
MGLLANRIAKNRPSSEEIARSIDRVCSVLSKVPGVWRIYIFGSCADETYQCNSGLDVAVIFETKSDYLHQKRQVLRSKIDTALPWEPSLLLREQFEEKKDVGGLAFEIFHRGTLLYDAGTEF